jgi:hypothetical protein
MNAIRSCVPIALLIGLLCGCGKGSDQSSIPTSAGVKVERGEVQGMSGFDVKLPKKAAK